MSDNEEAAIEKPFYVDRAKTGRAGCKKCKQKIQQGELRFAKLGHNPFGSGTMKMWHHIPCIFEVFQKQRATTRKIETPDDIGGWFDISEDDRKEIMKYFSEELKEIFAKHQTAPTIEKSPAKKKTSKHEENADKISENHKDKSFRAFRKLCSDVADASSYIAKTNIVKEFFLYGSDGKSFKGDIEMWCRLLLPGVVKRIYNVQSKQLIKTFSKIFGTDQEEMLEDLEKGDVAETICTFFERSKIHSPAGKSELTLKEVDSFLETLSSMTKEDEQINHFSKIVKKCTSNDLKMIIRLIKHDLRINAGAKHILEALHPDAYKAFQTSRDLKGIVENALKAKAGNDIKIDSKTDSSMNINLKLMTPVLPMLAQACKSVEMAMQKCPNGMFSEIKYDGERVQLHKEGNNFKYFSRSLKTVLSHKVNHFKDYIPQAFPHGKDLILDAEVLMVDTSGKPLPFGTLGIHKKNAFKDASVCLFVFDCIYYNGESLLDKTIKKRKRILQKNMVEIKNHIMFTEMQEIHKAEDLEEMMTKVFRLGLEGVVLKDLNSSYEPGKRHWLKIKKDYLFEGAMADSADLVVLGAWFGTGNKGGLMSIFLMGCYDENQKKWFTVTKVHGGHDDSTLEKLQTELKMVKISKDASKVPDWLKCTKTMVPDFVAKDPFKMPVWEITGAEFTQNQVHSADGISIRFPRVTKIRHDKDWTSATTLSELKKLYKTSKNTQNFSLKPGKRKHDTQNADDDDSGDQGNDKPSSTDASGSPSPKKKHKKKADSDEESEKTKTENITHSPSRKNAKLTYESSDTEEYEWPGGSGSPTSKACKSAAVEGTSDEEREKSRATDKTSGPSPKSSRSPKADDNWDTDDTETDVEADTGKSSTSNGHTIKNPLPDVFVGCVIQMPENYKENNLLRRYLLAYGAILYDPEKKTTGENSDHKVTHVIHLKRKSPIRKEKFWADNVRHVHVDWLWDSIKLLERQKERKYAVTAAEK